MSVNWSTAPPSAATRAARWCGPRSSARSWTAMPALGRTRRPWSVTSPKAAPAWRWWSAGPGRARPGRWGGPGGVRAGRLPGPWLRPTGIATVGLAEEGFADTARSTGCCWTSSAAGWSWTGGPWWWTRPPWSAPEARPLLRMRSGRGQGGAGRRRPPVRLHRRRRRLPRPPPGWEHRNSPSTAGRSRPGSSARSTTCAPATSSRPSPPMPSMTASAPSRPATTATAPWWPTGGRRTRPGRPVIYAHRRAQVDQLNQVCQRLRAEAGQLDPSASPSGIDLRGRGCGGAGRQRPDRLGVVNGTTAVILELDVSGRAMTVRTLEEEPPKTAAARLVPGRHSPARPVAPGRSGLCPHRHALPGPHRAAGAAGPGRRRGHAGRLCTAHQKQAPDRPVPDRRAGTARPDDEHPHPARRRGRRRSCWPGC